METEKGLIWAFLTFRAIMAVFTKYGIKLSKDGQNTEQAIEWNQKVYDDRYLFEDFGKSWKMQVNDHLVLAVMVKATIHKDISESSPREHSSVHITIYDNSVPSDPDAGFVDMIGSSSESWAYYEEGVGNEEAHKPLWDLMDDIPCEERFFNAASPENTFTAAQAMEVVEALALRLKQAM